MAATGRSSSKPAHPTLKFRLLEKKPLALPSTPALPNVFDYIVDLGEPEPGAV